MTLNYGWCHLDRGTSFAVQFALGKSLMQSTARGDDPSLSHLYGDSHFGWDGGTMVRTFNCREAIFRNRSDAAAFIAKCEGTTGTMALEWQVTTTATAANMFRFDGSNTTYEVFYKGYDNLYKAAPGTSTVFKIKTIKFEQGG